MVFSSHEHVSSVTEFWRTQLNSTNNYIRITSNDVLLRRTFIQHLLCSKHTVPPSRPPSSRIHTNSYWTMVKANISWNHWRKNLSYNTEVIFQHLLLVIWDTFQIRYFYWCNLHDVLFKNYLFLLGFLGSGSKHKERNCSPMWYSAKALDLEIDALN